MKNKSAVITEIHKRVSLAIKRGDFETQQQRVSRLIGCLMKSYYLSDGRLISLRAYWIKYNKEEYKRLVRSIHSQVAHGGFDKQVHGDNLDFFNYWHSRNNKCHVATDFCGRVPAINPYVDYK